MNKKTIGINQRIPLDTLYAVLVSYLNGNCSNDYILEQLRLEFDGENRLNKALQIVLKIIQRNPIIDFITDNNSEVKIAINKKTDRNVILISLLNSAYPFSFDVLRAFGKFFAVQDVVNRETIQKALSSIYGGNRATANAIDSVVPMMIEAGLIIRPKIGVYSRNEKLKIYSPITKQVYIESFKSNNVLEGIQDYQMRDPYFLFIND